MKKPVAAKPAKVRAIKAKTSTGRPQPKKKPPAKPAHVPAAVRVQRHAAAVKAAKTRSVNAKKAKAHPRRKLALGEAVSCCSAEALAASLRLAGHAVSDADVLALYWHTASDPDAGASIAATLEAAAEFGLAGVRPARFQALSPRHGIDAADFMSACILGLSLPAPHAVLEQDGQWWTWGEPWSPLEFPGAVLEEAWTVTWEAP